MKKLLLTAITAAVLIGDGGIEERSGMIDHDDLNAWLER